MIERRFHSEVQEVVLDFQNQQAHTNRKKFFNPITPGVSIGHPSISAGTAGCIVYDSQTDEPYVLSNWHVLQGKGRIGDEILQPGTYDDNRKDRNVMGHLVRSHLGNTGDCAIASISPQHRYVPKIIDLGIKVNRIGDLVVKSGRTTNVTYGVVTRIDTMVKIAYDGVGIKQIGYVEMWIMWN